MDFAEPKVTQSQWRHRPWRVPHRQHLPERQYRPGFEDRRARLGDIVTILIVENVTASQKSTSTVNRPRHRFHPAFRHCPSNSPKAWPNWALAATPPNDFSGKGGTESANTFSGSITATVIDVMPNGHLVVAGEKQIGVNQNVDVLRFSGTVDPRVMQPWQHRQFHTGGQCSHGVARTRRPRRGADSWLAFSVLLSFHPL